MVIKILRNPTGVFATCQASGFKLCPQVEEMVNVYLRAFEGDIAIKSMTGGDRALEPLLHRMMIAQSEAQHVLGWNTFFASLSEMTKHRWTTTLETEHKDVVKALLGPQYVDSWLASLIVADPKCQHRGHGSALSVNKIAALRTRTVENKWYKSLGFELLGETTLPESTSPTSHFPDFMLKWQPHK
ncbi:hypothetical protein C8J56DRAFT_1057688 [Mycena floridula]|nr:hypothetical protein C8J56DRAFT_1057688 [Mycena floridula]